MKSLLDKNTPIVEIKIPVIKDIPTPFEQYEEEIKSIINEIKKEDYLITYPYFTQIEGDNLGYLYSPIKEKRELISLLFTLYYDTQFGRQIERTFAEFGRIVNRQECYNTTFIDWLYQKEDKK